MVNVVAETGFEVVFLKVAMTPFDCFTGLAVKFTAVKRSSKRYEPGVSVKLAPISGVGASIMATAVPEATIVSWVEAPGPIATICRHDLPPHTQLGGRGDVDLASVDRVAVGERVAAILHVSADLAQACRCLIVDGERDPDESRPGIGACVNALRRRRRRRGEHDHGCGPRAGFDELAAVERARRNV